MILLGYIFIIVAVGAPFLTAGIIKNDSAKCKTIKTITLITSAIMAVITMVISVLAIIGAFKQNKLFSSVFIILSLGVAVFLVGLFLKKSIIINIAYIIILVSFLFSIIVDLSGNNIFFYNGMITLANTVILDIIQLTAWTIMLVWSLTRNTKHVLVLSITVSVLISLVLILIAFISIRTLCTQPILLAALLSNIGKIKEYEKYTALKNQLKELNRELEAGRITDSEYKSKRMILLKDAQKSF